MTKRIKRPSVGTLQMWRDEGLTQQEIADLRGVSRATVSRWYATLDASEATQFDVETSVPQTTIVATRRRS